MKRRSRHHPGKADGAERERDRAAIVEGYERGGIADIGARLIDEGMYEEQCADWRA